MNIIQQPHGRELAADMKDFIIDTDVSLRFKVQFGGKTILSEDYVPDVRYQVCTHKLGKFLSQALWGVWPSGAVTGQPHMAGSFDFLIDDSPSASSFIQFSRLAIGKPAGDIGFLSLTLDKVVRPGQYVWVTVPAGNGDISVSFTGKNGMQTEAIAQASPDYPVTVDISPSVIEALAQNELHYYEVVFGGKAMHVNVDRNSYAEVFQFRFKNVFDAPETVSCVGGLSDKPAESSNKGYLFGVERKFDVSPSDEYIARSGVIFMPSDYKLWHDLGNAQEVQFLCDGRWLPVIVSKINYEHHYSRSKLTEVEFSFRLADPDQAALL